MLPLEFAAPGTGLVYPARESPMFGGKKSNDWITWKTDLASRFKRRITVQEILDHQNERKLRHNGSLVDYIYSKDTLMEKAPFTIPQTDRISMIIGDITEEKWQIALATQNSNTVEELIDRATTLDAIRSAKQKHNKYSPKPQIRSYTHDEQRRKYKPITDDVRDITCGRCGNKGHASFMCSLLPPSRDTEIQALCDPCADITVIQQYCVPNDIVIHPWSDGQFQVVDHEIKPIGWISLNIIAGNVEHMLPKIGICTQLPFKLILGFDGQQQVQGRCSYDPNGSLCISTPTSFHLYECIHASKPSINCVGFHQPSHPSLDDVTLSVATPNAISSETKLIPKSAGHSTIQQAQLDAVIEKFTDVFYSNDDNIVLCPYVEFKIELQHERPIRF
ncbi:CCHC-type domain-containing protein [Trichonephila clavipes]|nr:CCHC-type domain-containing protein [Trichonephila clavipes]